MKDYGLYFGLDVHAEMISVAVAERGRGEARHIADLPNDAATVVKALKKAGSLGSMLVCYEAGACGYELYRALSQAGIECEVVAPTLIPVKAGDRVKTDKRDAKKLARNLRAGELTAVWVPDEAHEALRDLVRARSASREDQRRARQRLQKFLLRRGLKAPISTSGKSKKENKRVTSFGREYTAWLGQLSFALAGEQLTFDDYYAEVRHQTTRVLRLDKQIADEVAKTPALKKMVKSLQALRGVAATTATLLAMEIGHFGRFDKPAKLMAYAGLVPSEASSGGPGKAQRGAITKTGNRHVRTALVESAWSYRHKPNKGTAAAKRRVQLPAEVVHIAEKAELRLGGRFARLRATDKAINKVTTAIGRELLGFVWAIAKQVETELAQSSEEKAA